MVLQQWDPFGELRRADSLFDRVWRGFWVQPASATSRSWSIPIDIVEDDERLIVSASLPGLKSDDIKVSVDGNVLTVRAKASSESESSHENENEAGYLVRERRHGSFARSIRLPKSVDREKIESRYQDGVLRVELPKVPEQTPREIEVKVA
ncbi:MAG: Hsp20/alpha crystallin family protein [Chloroflexi bacterium]|nr:Hsp20/alpha crystallin family protein [Chloroflexota bacterium]MCH8101834.1 Hsp20/alpha crystallin family protein [Chloroflexota bacterium]